MEEKLDLILAALERIEQRLNIRKSDRGKSHSRWTPEEENILVGLYHEGYKELGEITKRHNEVVQGSRTEGAIKSRLFKLGLHIHCTDATETLYNNPPF